ncbi:MAG: IMP cyclohydrolase [Proteobacteria bacterium]|nr:IMP cyclohydrolase [Pseudomonadota bacterium]
MAKDLKAMYKTVMDDHFPRKMEISFIDEGGKRSTLQYEKVSWVIEGVEKGLRYGENPGQEAALFKLVNGNLVLGEVKTIDPGRYLASNMEMLQSGKHPGKTNITDVDNALNILRYLPERPAVVIVKHNNPCGAARADSLEQAYRKAFSADRVAAFGGAIALNRPVDKATAEGINAQYAEVVAAPDYEEEAFQILAQRKNLRILRIENIARLEQWVGRQFVDIKSLIDGGIIVQASFVPVTRKPKDLQPAVCEYKGKEYKIKRQPTEKEIQDMLFGWLVEAGVSSNSVLYVKDDVTVGIGTGEQDRVGVAEIARDKAYRKLADRYCFEAYKVPYNDLKDEDKRREIDERVKKERGGIPGSVMVSDAFFPFKDGVEVGIREGVGAVIQPGGSERDFEVIEACNEANVAMMFTGQRSFKH